MHIIIIFWDIYMREAPCYWGFDTRPKFTGRGTNEVLYPDGWLSRSSYFIGEVLF